MLRALAKPFLVQLTREQHVALDRHCGARGVSRAGVVREAVRRYLADCEARRKWEGSPERLEAELALRAVADGEAAP